MIYNAQVSLLMNSIYLLFLKHLLYTIYPTLVKKKLIDTHIHTHSNTDITFLNTMNTNLCFIFLQKAVQIFLVVQALLMVPIMLLIKPLLTYRRQEKIREQVKEST